MIVLIIRYVLEVFVYSNKGIDLVVDAIFISYHCNGLLIIPTCNLRTISMKLLLLLLLILLFLLILLYIYI